jgi:hypothetical protein
VNAKQRRRRAYSLAYTQVAQAVESGYVYTADRPDETEQDKEEIAALLGSIAKRLYDFSDIGREDEK